MDGNQLYELRTKNNVTQSELATYLGYFTQGEPNRSMIARMEKGYQKINHRHETLIKAYFATKEFIDV